MKKERILILDFDGPNNQLIARKIRNSGVYSEVVPHDISLEKIKEYNPKGIIFAGDILNEYSSDYQRCNLEIFNLNIPILGIGYGFELITNILIGETKSRNINTYHKANLTLDKSSKLFTDIKTETSCFLKNSINLELKENDFKSIATNTNGNILGFENTEKQIYAIQYYPELSDTPFGIQMLNNFLYNICNCSGNWKLDTFVNDSIQKLKTKIGDKKVVCALSGGVDSSVSAVLLHKAIGENLTCIFVDHGLLRKNEANEVEDVFRKQFDINLIKVDAQDRFLDRLIDVTDPETKRKIIGEEFIRVFEEEAKKLGKIHFLAQGTIYPDIIESGNGKKVIKSHHNVGGLPEHVDFEDIIEPLKDLFKDEVRQAGLELGISEKLVYRQPFPGPGLGIRVIGAITRKKLEILKNADFIFREEIAISGLDKSINQYFAVLTNLKSVGMKNNERTYDYTLALRAVETTDFMTAEFSKIPYDILEKVSQRICTEVPGINRIVYDITSKPPSTIEWE